MPRPPVLSPQPPSPAPVVRRRLPASRTVLPRVPLDGDYLRLPVGPGAIHVSRYGFGGPAVLLVHGFTTSAPLWRHVAPMLLARGCQVIVADMLGFGESDRPVGGPYTVGAQARYLDRALALLRLDRVLAVGHDIGGVVLRRLGELRPERLASIMFCSPTPGEQASGPEIDAVRDQAGPALLEISSRPLGVVDLLGPVLRAAVSERDAMPDRLVARFSAPYTGSQGARHLLDLARAVAEDEDGGTAGVSEVSTLRVTGEDDPMVATVGIPLLRVAAARRLVPLEQPGALSALIMERVQSTMSSSVSLEDGDEIR